MRERERGGKGRGREREGGMKYVYNNLYMHSLSRNAISGCVHL